VSLPRAFCLIGGAVDAAATVALLSPAVAARMLALPDVDATPVLLYAMRTGAALMAGWTCLLLRAAADPIRVAAWSSSPSSP
jgi:hypothetical protein